MSPTNLAATVAPLPLTHPRRNLAKALERAMVSNEGQSRGRGSVDDRASGYAEPGSGR